MYRSTLDIAGFLPDYNKVYQMIFLFPSAYSVCFHHSYLT